MRSKHSSPHSALPIPLLDSYAHDSMGGGEGLSDFAKAHVVTELAKVPNAFLDVLSGNASAMHLYQHSGFVHYALDAATGQARLMQKWLD
jgi:hypothetical protein